MAQAFNNFFTTNGPEEAREVNKKEMSNQSLAFVLLTKLSFFFCLKARNVTAIYMLTSEINERKACRIGWTKFPVSYLNWLVVLLLGPHCQVYLRSLLKLGFVKRNWMVAKVTPIFIKVLNPIITIIDQYLSYPLSRKCSKNNLPTTVRLLR